MISSLMTSTSPLALSRAMASLSTFRTPERVAEFHDVFVPCEHETQPEKPFRLLDQLTRIPTKCYYCDGSGRCQFDYPRPGSGKDGNGEKEYYCSGSGKCDHCSGSGWIYTRQTVTIH